MASFVQDDAKVDDTIKTQQIVMIVDISGSMSTFGSELVSSLELFIASQNKIDPNGKVSIYVFNNTINCIVKNILIKDIKLTSSDFIPNGSTALNDAIGTAITDHIDIKDVIYVILTDGAENASQKYSSSDVKKLITDAEQKNSCKFVYLGANQDSFMVGNNMGIGACANYSYSPGGLFDIARSASQGIAEYRSATIGLPRAVSDSTPIRVRSTDATAGAAGTADTVGGTSTIVGGTSTIAGGASTIAGGASTIADAIRTHFGGAGTATASAPFTPPLQRSNAIGSDVIKRLRRS